MAEASPVPADTPLQSAEAERSAEAEQSETKTTDDKLKSKDATAEEQAKAAAIIQRNYRGYKSRRELDGFGLSPSTRWLEAVKEAQYRNLVRPRARSSKSGEIPAPERTDSSQSDARKYWRHATQVVRRADSDDTSDTEGDGAMTPEQLAEYRSKKQAAKREREKNAKRMGLEYFLEMVDVKHRYGSHLRSYHEVWKQSDTNENFFYWLDHGDGRSVVTEKCNREKLERDQVRYLSREERRFYLVRVDSDGRLCWAKNGERISTRNEFKDSLQGIVPEDDPTPSWRDSRGQEEVDDDASSCDSDSSMEATVPLSGQPSSPPSKPSTPSAQTPQQKVMALASKPRTRRKWIYTADTSFRMYIGYKQPGAFQHSSFLSGARLSSAGQIKIKDGQLRELSPLSGHYRPPTQNFRQFVHSLQDARVDMSRVSIPRSYAVLLGVQTYKQSKARVKLNMSELKHRANKVFKPDEARKAEQAKLDKSQSAAREREFLAAEKAKEDESKKSHGLVSRLLRRTDQAVPEKPTS